ncbi:MAG: hypothetical protein WA666_05885 [Nitrospirota bacterium]
MLALLSAQKAPALKKGGLLVMPERIFGFLVREMEMPGGIFNQRDELVRAPLSMQRYRFLPVKDKLITASPATPQASGRFIPSTKPPSG